LAVRKGEATRLRVIEEAARQAAVRGLASVSLSDVADAVGLSKSGLFKHFDTKEEMQLAVVEATSARFHAFILDAAMDAPPGRPRVERIFERWLEWGDTEWRASGCPMYAFSVELDDQPGPLRDTLRERLAAFRARAIAEFRARRDPPLSHDEAQAAYFQTKSFLLGHADARRMMGDADARRATEAAFRALLDRTSQRAA
jgi:AcrR family transcriptional regulator